MNMDEIMEMLAFIVYLCVVLGVGIFFFIKGRKDTGDKSYFLGGRGMNGWVAALSAGASDMSAWVLMGLPGSIYLLGMGQVWISVGLLIGTLLAWIFIAPRLRRMSILADDAITIPQFLTNRFKETNPALQVVCAVIFIVVYCIYSASSIVACGSLFNKVFGMSPVYAMIGATIIIMVYTFLGGFNAVCWTDFFQGLLMLMALMAAPIVAVIVMNRPGFTPAAEVVTPDHYYNLLSSGQFDWTSMKDILSGMGWGLGYFGMPHILVRYMSIKSEKEMKKSRLIGSFWTFLILGMASVVALVAHQYLGASLSADEKSLVFISMVRSLFPPLLAGILLSAILAASMSTADSQLLASSSAFASDLYKPLFRKNASDKEMLWVGRGIVALIAVVALIIAMSPNCGGIMALVECAWGGFGSAFGPAIILALFWKRFTHKGAIFGIIAGFVTDALWYMLFSGSVKSLTVVNTGIYEIIPGFIVSMIVAVVVSLIDAEPSAEVQALVDQAAKPLDQES
ncbi:MAG: sodium/proline symporter [Lachnospiraceae bacterium]|nr:sodium/proline symporter [Lachnospiraceae bacterium]